MNRRTPEWNYFYLLSPETCRILELDGEGSGYCSGSPPAPGAALGLSPECWLSWKQLALPSSVSVWTDFTFQSVWVMLWGREGGVKGQDSASPLFLPCSAAVLLCCFPSGVTGFVRSTVSDFLLKGNHTTKTSSLRLFQAELFGPLSLAILVP